MLSNKRQELMKHEERFKIQEEEGRRELALKQEQLQIEEQRVEKMSAAAKEQLLIVEEKERELKEKAKEEYDKARTSAKKAYEDATAANQSQSDLLEKELQALNGEYFCTADWLFHLRYLPIFSFGSYFTVLVGTYFCL